MSSLEHLNRVCLIGSSVCGGSHLCLFGMISGLQLFFLKVLENIFSSSITEALPTEAISMCWRGW